LTQPFMTAAKRTIIKDFDAHMRSLEIQRREKVEPFTRWARDQVHLVRGTFRDEFTAIAEGSSPNRRPRLDGGPVIPTEIGAVQDLIPQEDLVLRGEDGAMRPHTANDIQEAMTSATHLLKVMYSTTMAAEANAGSAGAPPPPTPPPTLVVEWGVGWQVSVGQNMPPHGRSTRQAARDTVVGEIDKVDPERQKIRVKWATRDGGRDRRWGDRSWVHMEDDTVTVLSRDSPQRANRAGRGMLAPYTPSTPEMQQPRSIRS
jgi:hypothetical protein